MIRDLTMSKEREQREYIQKIPRPLGYVVEAPEIWINSSPLKAGVSLKLVNEAMSVHDSLLLPSGASRAGSSISRNVSAGVLIPIYERNEEAWMILTRRSRSLRSHAGEVAFPGGKVETGESLRQAAIRETYEEIGLPPDQLYIIGELLSVTTFSSLVSMVVFVATTVKPDFYKVSSDEVEKVIEFPISYLFEDGVYSVEKWPSPNGMLRPMHFFHFGEDIVWGATARMLYEFLKTISRASIEDKRVSNI